MKIIMALQEEHSVVTRGLQAGWSHEGFQRVFLFQWGIQNILKMEL